MSTQPLPPRTTPTPAAPGPAAVDVAVIGGGASGLAAAIAAGRAGARTVVLERDVEAGLPILATGNGRCNVSNTRLTAARYRHPTVARTLMGAEPEQRLARFFASLGLATVAEADRLYPASKQADSVRDVLLRAAARAEVEVRCCQELVAVRHEAAGSRWELAVEEPRRTPRAKAGADFRAAVRQRRRAAADAPRTRTTVRARTVILACGGHAARVAALFSLPHLGEEPVLCPVACEPAEPRLAHAFRALDGLRVEGALSLRRDGETVWSEPGEVLFRPYGLSGIVAFDCSRRVRPGDTIGLDLFPAHTEAQLLADLQERTRAFAPYRADADWLCGLLARPLAGYVCAAAANETLAALAHTCKQLRFRAAGTAQEQQAQVRRGGIPFDAVALPSLAIKGHPGLFACGEALDMDADCGGFNLAWAWLSGAAAGEAAARDARHR